MRRGRPRYPALLAPREQELLSLLREGLTNELIASRLGISESGARYHVSEILSKLGVSSRQEAVMWLSSAQKRRGVKFGASYAPSFALKKLTPAIAVPRAMAAAVAVAVALFFLLPGFVYFGSSSNSDGDELAALLLDFGGAQAEHVGADALDSLLPFEMIREVRLFERAPNDDLKLSVSSTSHLLFQDIDNWLLTNIGSTGAGASPAPLDVSLRVANGLRVVSINGVDAESAVTMGKYVPGEWFMPLDARVRRLEAGSGTYVIERDGLRTILRAEMRIEAYDEHASAADRQTSWVETNEYVYEAGFGVPLDIRTYVDDVLVKEETVVSLVLVGNVIR